MNKYKLFVENILEDTGIRINGPNPFDIQVYQDRFYKEVALGGSLALGETYMEGVWDCNSLDHMFTMLLNGNLEKASLSTLNSGFSYFWQGFFNSQSRKNSRKLVANHYNIGNDLFRKMLDPYMMYTCAYWKKAENLKEAQVQKMDLICRKLKLSPGMKILDLGCGWGGFAAYASKVYQVNVVGVTLSKEQVKVAKNRCKNLSVQIKLMDYRDITGEFDRIVSIGMIEHVGYQNYGKYMEVVNRLIKPEGISLIQTIGSNQTNFKTDPWIGKYIFHNSLIPSMVQLSIAMEPYFVLEDVHNFGLHYDKTLMAWLANFKEAWTELESSYSSEFFRMWEYYLSVSAASFRSRKNNLWQIVMTKSSYPKEYIPVR
ncbi:cyclopropane fatty acyl phospholipid synthase [Algoriphagus persicinus]|uniref:cyclopropane fatty acyl phospholipid synthase n=1 Tax=Algoriphagus persicinus TaxID=3108754 RepID=UPI002B3AAF1A|nr:cyclopropane fatty acyl phospholipid synthase [Algoriphagus sp. E1-3-M2]MEB2785235.1 cyclopropane fatty acyl phospholipid synthase [Algoriphagus sp. E1-3-M2]